MTRYFSPNTTKDQSSDVGMTIYLETHNFNQKELTTQCAQPKVNQPERHGNEFLSRDGREAAKETENAIFKKKKKKQSVAFPGVTHKMY